MPQIFAEPELSRVQASREADNSWCRLQEAWVLLSTVLHGVRVRNCQ